MAHKRCMKTKEPTQCPTYVDESDPGYMGNLPLDDLVSHIEGKSSIKGKSKRRKNKFMKKKKYSKVELNVPEPDGNSTALDSTKQDNVADQNCSENFGDIHSHGDHQMIAMTKFTTTKTKNNGENKGVKRLPAIHESSEKLDLYTVAAIPKDGEGLVSDEDYLRAICDDKQYETVMMIVKDPRFEIDTGFLRDFQRQYSLEYLCQLRAGVRKTKEIQSIENIMDENGTKNIRNLEVPTGKTVQDANSKPTFDLPTKENTMNPQKFGDNIAVVQSNVDHQMTEEKEVDTTKKNNKNKKKRDKAVENSESDPFEKVKALSEAMNSRRAGAILSNEEYLKALIADEELYEYAETLKSANPKFDGKELYEIQSEYTIDYLKCLRMAVCKFTAVLSTNAALKDLFPTNTMPLKYDFEQINLENRLDGDYIRNIVINPDDVLKILKYPNSNDATPFDNREYHLFDNESERCEQIKKKERLDAMKSRRNKKTKETNTVIVDQAAPGYVGNLSVDDILEHIENKPLSGGKSTKSGGKKKLAKPREKKKDIVDTINSVHQKTGEKEVSTNKKDNKKKQKKKPADSAFTDYAEKLNPALENRLQPAYSCRRGIEDRLKDLSHVVREHLGDSAVVAVTVRNQSENKSERWKRSETSVDPAESAIYGEVLKYYYMDKEKENTITSSSARSPGNADRRPDVELPTPANTPRNSAEEKEWLDYFNRKNRSSHFNSQKQTMRSTTNPYNGVCGRAADVDFSLFDLD